MIKIENAIFNRCYRYLWLKSVESVDLSVHCEKCLIGKRDSRIKHRMEEVSDIELPSASYYYLCGVSDDWKWEHNLHLAFKEREGSVIEIDNEFIKCRIINAEEVAISKEYIDTLHPLSVERLYSRCRNWWFAHYISKVHPERVKNVGYRKIF